MKRRFAVLAALALGLVQAQAQGFQTLAPFALLMDFETGAILFEKAADEPMVPASMVKIMTAEILFRELKEGRLTLESEFLISENAWRRGGGPSGGAAMFALLNSRVKLGDLLRGIIVQSGNDAAIAAAEGVAGTEGAFARLMNERARSLSLTRTRFANATGFADPDQKTTARDLGRLSHHIISTYPDLYPIFGERDFTWNRIRQQNRNPLLNEGIGADGIKTGNLEESGFGLVGSAVQAGQRLIVVVNGLKTSRDRQVEARKLIEWGFRNFDPRTLFNANETIGEAKVYGGARSSVPLVASKPVRLLVPRGSSERLTARIHYTGPVPAPVAEGAEIGRLVIMRGETRALDMPLFAGEAVEKGTLRQRAFDAALELGADVLRQAFDKARTAITAKGTP